MRARNCQHHAGAVAALRSSSFRRFCKLATQLRSGVGGRPRCFRLRFLGAQLWRCRWPAARARTSLTRTIRQRDASGFPANAPPIPVASGTAQHAGLGHELPHRRAAGLGLTQVVKMRSGFIPRPSLTQQVIQNLLCVGAMVLWLHGLGSGVLGCSSELQHPRPGHVRHVR
jgi:hypothetical protein